MARSCLSTPQEYWMENVVIPASTRLAWMILLSSICSPLGRAQEGPAPVPPPAPAASPVVSSSVTSSVSSTASSSTSPHAVRPRIGLALGGGAALGLAEIGVIQWIEENHIPVDRIAGTSMGGIIAAMYATGMSPAEIQKYAQHVDWGEAMLPESAYRELSFRRKQDRRDYQIESALGLKHGLNGPNGFNAGY